MKHSEALIQVVAKAIPSPSGFSPRAQAIEILDALRAAEAEEMKTDRQALDYTIAEALNAKGATAEVETPYKGTNVALRSMGARDVEVIDGDDLAPGIADAIMADFHVSLRKDVTEPIR